MRNLCLANGHFTYCMLEDILVEVIKEISAKPFEFRLVFKTRNPKLDLCLGSFQDWLTTLELLEKQPDTPTHIQPSRSERKTKIA